LTAVNVSQAVLRETRQVLSVIALASERDPRVLHAAQRAVEKRLTEQPPLRLEDGKAFVEEKIAEYTDVLKAMDTHRLAEPRGSDGDC
jgi:hypothetical protein